MWLFSQVHWGLAFGGPTQPLPDVLPAGELPLSVWPEEPWTPLLGIRPSHQRTTRYGAAPFQPLRSLFLVLMEFKPSPFSLFGSVPAAASTFPLSLQLLLGRVLFLHSLPCLRPLSTHKNSSLPSVASGSPGSPLCAAYLLNSVVQVVQIVVLILRSVF